jgi:hypothetical protein
MHTGTGQITETHLDGSMRIECRPELVPGPGQYTLAHASGSDSPLPLPVFLYDSAPTGFRAAPPLPPSWRPGTQLALRGPLGHGFVLSSVARRMALVAFDDHPARLQAMMALGLKQNAEIVVVTDAPVQGLPEAVEVQPLKSLQEICKWADFIAVDATREDLDRLKEMLIGLDQVLATREAQILIRTSMPCGALAECGVCAITIRHEWRMACKEGPVFILQDIFK